MKKEIKINQPADNMFGNPISIDPSRNKVVVTFFDEQHGVRLVERGPGDNHICFEILSEDDGHWFVSSGNGASSFWMPGLIKVLRYAQKWMKENCIADIDGNGNCWGYKAK